MVLFYCTAVAMKRQDQAGIAEGLEDVFDPDELESIEFSGYVIKLTITGTPLTRRSEIADNRYLHAFRVYKDEDSGCVRFEATARRGPLKTIPIWTAFVTKHIGDRRWMKRVGAATVQFRDFHPYVFCEGYRPPKGPSGKYQLTFSAPEGR